MRFPFTTNNDGWKELEQHGIAIPTKWVDDICSSGEDNDGDQDDTIFVGVDVKGDGNCLLRCFSQSGLLPYDYEEIRQALLHTARSAADKFGKLAFECCFDERGYQTYLDESLAVDGEWTGDFEMLLFLKTFGINVVSFTMSTFGLLCFNADQYVKEAMHLPSLRQCSETIYLLHHEYGEPLQETDEGNHFCLLLPTIGNVHPITGAFMDPSRAFHPPTMREALPHDTSKFTGNGSPSSPLEEVDSDDKSAQVNNKPVVVKRKAPTPEMSPYRDTKRMTRSREMLTFPSHRWRETSQRGRSPFTRDSWFQSIDSMLLQEARSRRLAHSGYAFHDDWFY